MMDSKISISSFMIKKEKPTAWDEWETDLREVEKRHGGEIPAAEMTTFMMAARAIITQELQVKDDGLENLDI